MAKSRTEIPVLVRARPKELAVCLANLQVGENVVQVEPRTDEAELLRSAVAYAAEDAE